MDGFKKQLGVKAAWIGGSQVAMRMVRILSTIVVVRFLEPELLGLAAIALAVNEISHVFAKNATNSRVIRAADDELLSLSNTAYFINWIAGISIFLLQCFVGYVLAIIYEEITLFYLISALAVGYLLLPIAQVQSAINLRLEKIALISKNEVHQTVVDALLTIALVILGFGVWSLVIPKIAVIPIWIKTHRAACDWVPPKTMSFVGLSDHMQFNSRVLGVEILGVVRHNIDYVLIGYFLGMQALGIYYFAFNAGLGLSRGFIMSLNNAFYPYLCSVRDQPIKLVKRYKRGLSYMLILMVPLLSFQALMAEHYVPILFGQQWSDRGADIFVSLLCLAGVPLLISEAGSQFVRAQGRSSDDLKWHVIYSFMFVFAVAVGLQWGLMGVVVSVLFSQCIAAPLHYIFVVEKQLSNSETGMLAES